MPTVLIEVRRRYTEAEEIAIVDAVHGALVTAFQIPAKDKNVRLIAHEPHRFAVPEHLAQPEYRTLVTIDYFHRPFGGGQTGTLRRDRRKPSGAWCSAGSRDDHAA